MEKINLSSVTKETRTYIKTRTVQLHNEGMKGTKIALLLNISEDAVSRIVSSFKKNGKIPEEKTRGRKKGEKRILSTTQEKEIQRIIMNQCPDQVKLGFALWTRAAVKELILSKYGIELNLRSITNYLNRWGLTCQRPTKRAYRQNDVQRKNFMEHEYPKIAERAKKEQAEIYWGDETGINNQEYYMRGFAPRGETPMIKVFPKREKINMISAINNYGTCRFMCYVESMTQQRFIEFMRRLIRDAKRKVFFVVDNLKVHHGKIVQKWLNEHKEQIEIFFTPTYSPDLNPDEYLNHILKQSIHSGRLPRTQEDLRKKTYSFMRKLQNQPERVTNLFKHKCLNYIRTCCA